TRLARPDVFNIRAWFEWRVDIRRIPHLKSGVRIDLDLISTIKKRTDGNSHLEGERRRVGRSEIDPGPPTTGDTRRCVAGKRAPASAREEHGVCVVSRTLRPGRSGSSRQEFELHHESGCC